MYESIIETKLHPPQSRKRLVSRPQLIQRLNEGLDRKFVLVSAPAGYGKTTAVEEWGQDLDRPIAWLSLDDNDNEPYRFLSYLVASLSSIEPEFGIQITSALQSSSSLPLEELLDRLSTSLISIDGPYVMVLDDYHVIFDVQVHDSISTIIERLPPSATLVMLTREDPPIQLSRLRAHDEMLEIRAVDLKFSRSEASKLLNETMGLELDWSEVAMLEARTEGWIAGLVLAGHSLAGARDRWEFLRDFAGDDRNIMDYLVEEVLAGLPDEIEEFLLKSSVLKRLTASLCQAVVFGGGHLTQAQSILEKLERTNLFTIALDRRREWYRYHPLFRELLHNLLSMKSPDQVAVQHLRACRWYEENRYITEAIDHAQTARDSDRAIELIGNHSLGMLSRAEVRTVQMWFRKLTESEIQSDPYLCILFAWTLWLASYTDPDSSINLWLDKAEEKLVNEDDHSTHSAEVPGHVQALRTALMLFSTGETEAAIDGFETALDLVDKPDLWLKSMVLHLIAAAQLMAGRIEESIRFDSEALQFARKCEFDYLILGIHFDQAMIALRQGRLSDAEAKCLEGIRMASRPGQQLSPSSGMLQILMGKILVERDDLASAEPRLINGLELLSLTAEKELNSLGRAELARIHQARGEWDKAQDMIQQLDVSTPWCANYRSALQAMLWLTEAEYDPERLGLVDEWVEELAAAFDEMSEIPAALPPHDIEFATLIIRMRARLACLKRHPPDRVAKSLEEILKVLKIQMEFAERGGWNERMLSLLILETLALHFSGETDGALRSLKAALSLGESEGYIRLFADQGSEIGRLLHDLAAKGENKEYIGVLLAAFPEAEAFSKPSSPEGEDVAKMVEPLSDRELAVLRLIAEGLSNREIAQRLYLSTNTVKGHSRNIYGKLGVNNRTQAAARARILGLLPRG